VNVFEEEAPLISVIDRHEFHSGSFHKRPVRTVRDKRYVMSFSMKSGSGGQKGN